MRRQKKNLVERAYIEGPRLGLDTWCEDEAGPFQTMPHAGSHWAEQQRPLRYPHEYVREGTAKLLTLFHPADGKVIVKGVCSCTNKVLHPWVEKQMSAVVDALPPAKTSLSEEENRKQWESWQEGLTVRFTLPENLPSLRVLLVLDNLTGHKTPDFVLWLISHGIMALYTPLGG
jgi:ribosome modulation factor